MTRILVTGAAGFIGSHLAECLLHDGWQVRGVDALTDTYDAGRKQRNLAPLLAHDLFSFVRADLATEDLDALLDGVDVVAHLAAEPGVPASWGSDFARYVERNGIGMQRLLEAATGAGVRRFVYASSSSVYGDGVTTAVSEDAPLHPSSPYGATKLLGELLVGAYAEQRGLPGVSLRYFSVYGPRQRPDMAGHRFIEALLDGRPVTLYGDGGAVRDFTYVLDVVDATTRALTADLAPGTVVNVAGGSPVSIAELLAVLSELTGRRVHVDVLPQRHGDVLRTSGSTAAARRLLGWTPRTELRTGLAAQVAWHRAQRAERTGNGRDDDVSTEVASPAELTAAMLAGAPMAQAPPGVLGSGVGSAT